MTRRSTQPDRLFLEIVIFFTTTAKHISDRAIIYRCELAVDFRLGCLGEGRRGCGRGGGPRLIGQGGHGQLARAPRAARS